jgi:hypothetical protein
MTTQTNTMTDADFWSLVAEIGWGTKTTNYKPVEMTFLRRGLEFTTAFRAKYDEFESILYSAAAKAGFDYCCDSWGDTLSHVIGLGKDEFERNVANPRLLVERDQSGDYREKFSYCIPWASDFKHYSADGIEERRQENVAAYEAAKGRFPQVDGEIDTLLGLLGSDNWMEQGDKLKSLSESIEQTCKATLHRMMPHGLGVTDGGDVLMNKWCVWNLVSDASTFNQMGA